MRQIIFLNEASKKKPDFTRKKPSYTFKAGGDIQATSTARQLSAMRKAGLAQAAVTNKIKSSNPQSQDTQ